MSTHHPSKPSEEGKAPKVGLRRKFTRDSRSAAMLRPAYSRGEGPPPRRAEGHARRFRPRVPGPDRRRGTGGAAVNCPTTRCSTPAVAPRIGRGGSAPRGTQYKTSIPFAAIPHDIAADPRLSPTDLRVLAALFYFARADASCWPCDNSIAARVHRHPGTVRRSLRRLEDLGYIRRQPSWENPTGRLIHLTCREPDWERPRQVPVPAPAHGGIERRAGGSSAGARRRRRDRRKIENRRIGTPGTITIGSSPTARESPHPDRGGPAPGQGSRPGPRSPGNRPPPARAIGCRPGPSRGTSATPVSNPAQARAWVTSGLPRDQDALGLVPPRALPAPRAGLAPLDARAIGCRPGPSRGTSATPVSNPVQARAWATSGLPRDQDALGRVPGSEPRPPLDARAAGAACRDAGGVP